MKLYSYWRSSASYRVRIALNLKGLEYEIRGVNLLESEHRSEWYLKINPQGLVPTFVDDIPDPATGDPTTISQSLAIIDYLDEAYPWKRLLPCQDVATTAGRAHIRQLTHIIACDVHPLQNMRVIDKVSQISDEPKKLWSAWWIRLGFEAYESIVGLDPASFSHGNKPTVADCCLIPQVYNAKRLGLDLKPYPQIRRIYDNCMQLEAFKKAAPENQPDAPK